MGACFASAVASKVPCDPAIAEDGDETCALQVSTHAKQIANLATRRRCTHEGKDPWSTHHLVKCCSGLEKQLVNSSSGGRKHYECLAPLLPSPSLCNDCKTGCATAFCNPQDGSCQNQMDMPFYVMCNEPCAGEGTICGGPGRSGRTCCEPEYNACVRPTGTEEDKGDFYCGR